MADDESVNKRQKLEESQQENIEQEERYTADDLKLGEELVAAVKAGDLGQVKAMIEEKEADVCFNATERGRTPLHFASEAGHLSIVEYLLEQRHPYNMLDDDEVSAGELALKNKHQQVYDRLVAEGVRSELVIRAMAAVFDKAEEGEMVVPNEDYLNQKLHYDDNKLMDANNDAVMMGWEGPLMVEHAKVMCPKEGLDVLNVGFGLGLIDSELQKYKPKNHFIIEAHPDVYAHMKELGWDKKPGVTILFGRWQDMVPTLTQSFDGIFFDTYGGK
ncbi:hypothetical protein DM01DRAFT_1332651 [Hesseltinella vesiculosa]|uniref:Uncharacterized protein n=1 Tax=Hesseltinella vesiculosa TaxID=101127 RepID=A0A1X2GSN2_9FUNG|nr:hypothetical protein DM01DRAFT_1332651 [Hesseltinella vesiculosa]